MHLDHSHDVAIQHNALIPTWFGIGGRADRFAEPASIEELRRCIEVDPGLRVLGDGANLLVDDDGVGELVVSLGKMVDPAFGVSEFRQETGVIHVLAGKNLPQLVAKTVKLGLSGLEGLGGIPASLGGAVIMNAGGAFGQLSDVVVRVHGLNRAGEDVTLERAAIDFGYRRSRLNDLIITSVELALQPADPDRLRERHKEVMAYKKASQPLAEKSAGCCFKNPTLGEDVPGIGSAGDRVSAGMLIDRAGLKGLSVGGASVSPRHGNFIVVDDSARARDVIELMGLVMNRVASTFGVQLEPEVVIWRRNMAQNWGTGAGLAARSLQPPAKPLTVLVLGGGPDAEREVSLISSQYVADSLLAHGGHRVQRQIIDRISLDELRKVPADVIFPVLHGPFGEGGPLQDILELDGRPYVGCGPRAARAAMDKMATKLSAAKLGIRTPSAAILNQRDAVCPFELPVVIKPVHEGSSVGLHVCRSAADWERAHAAVVADLRQHPGRSYMVESAVLGGRELTVGVLDGRALPIIEIKPASGLYDYEAKYNRDDTRYELAPKLPPGVETTIQSQAVCLCAELGVKHVARVDFILDTTGTHWLLEVNTMPGFTGHSLLPMAAKHAGLDFPALTNTLVSLALRDRSDRLVPAR